MSITLSITYGPNQPVGLEVIRALLAEHEVAFPFGNGIVDSTSIGRLVISWFTDEDVTVEDVIAAAEHLSMRHGHALVEVTSDYISWGTTGVEGSRFQNGRLTEVGRSTLEWRPAR